MGRRRKDLCYDESLQRMIIGMTADTLQQVTEQIATRFEPQKVILFGSHAYGMPDQDSDVDLLVVMESNLRSIEQAVEIRKAVDFPFPTDLLVRTPRQIAERLKAGDQFLREVISKGKVLYEADNGRMDR